MHSGDFTKVNSNLHEIFKDVLATLDAIGPIAFDPSFKHWTDSLTIQSNILDRISGRGPILMIHYIINNNSKLCIPQRCLMSLNSQYACVCYGGGVPEVLTLITWWDAC